MALALLAIVSAVLIGFSLGTWFSVAMVGVAGAASRWEASQIHWAGWLFVVGIVVFSGSLYTLVLTGQRWLGAITPIGGLAFLAGWLLLSWSAFRG